MKRAGRIRGHYKCTKESRKRILQGLKPLSSRATTWLALKNLMKQIFSEQTVVGTLALTRGKDKEVNSAQLWWSIMETGWFEYQRQRERTDVAEGNILWGNNEVCHPTFQRTNANCPPQFHRRNVNFILCLLLCARYEPLLKLFGTSILKFTENNNTERSGNDAKNMQKWDKGMAAS